MIQYIWIIVGIFILYAIIKSVNSGEGYSPLFAKSNFYNSFSYELDERKPEDLEVIKKLIKHQLSARVYSNGYSAKANRDDLKYIMYKDHYDCGKMFEMASNTPNNSLRIAQDMVIEPQSREYGLGAGKSADSLRKMVLNKYKIDLETLSDVVEIDVESHLS